jgi:hypothetical protein
LKPEHQILDEGATTNGVDESTLNLDAEHRSESKTTTRASASTRGDEGGDGDQTRLGFLERAGVGGVSRRCTSVRVYTCARSRALMEAGRCRAVHFSQVGSCLHHRPHMQPKHDMCIMSCRVLSGSSHGPSNGLAHIDMYNNNTLVGEALAILSAVLGPCRTGF